jgi:glycoside/pentoside/hexuronide:cation symporter, GPH family
MAGHVDPRGCALTTKTTTNRDTFFYATGSFGLGVLTTVPSILLLYFCTETLHISASIAATLILIPKLWSIFWDPFVGSWSDRCSHRWGRRRPFMIIGLIGVVTAFVLLFNVPLLSAGQTIVWVGVTYFAMTTLGSLFGVPYVAIPAEISDNQSSLARLVSWRMMMLMVGILAGAAAAPMIIAAGGGGRSGYGFMSWVIGVICVVMLSFPVLMLRGRDRRPAVLATRTKRSSLATDLLRSMANVNFRRLSFAYLVQSIAFGAFAAITPYLITKGLGRTDADIGTAIGIYLLATTVAVPFWSRLGRTIGLRTALIWSAALYGLTALGIGVVVLAQLNWTIALVFLAIAGVPFAGLQVLPFTWVGDIIRAEAKDDEGRFSGIWIACEKLGMALGTLLAGQTIDLFKGDIAMGVGLFVCVVPLSLCLLSTFLLRSQRKQHETAAAS